MPRAPLEARGSRRQPRRRRTRARAARRAGEGRLAPSSVGPVDDEGRERLAALRRDGERRGPSGRPSRAPGSCGSRRPARSPSSWYSGSHLHVEHREGHRHVGAGDRAPFFGDLEREGVRRGRLVRIDEHLQRIPVLRRPTAATLPGPTCASAAALLGEVLRRRREARQHRRGEDRAGDEQRPRRDEPRGAAAPARAPGLARDEAGLRAQQVDRAEQRSPRARSPALTRITWP